MFKITCTITILLLYIATKAQYAHDSLKTAEDGYIHYYTKGIGKPVVLLQGGPGFSSYYMRSIADSLVNYKTILIDYRGHGRSQYKKPDTTWANIENIIMDVEIVRKKLNINQWSVIGNSYGSHFALYYAVKHPERTSKIVLTASPGTSNAFLIYYSDNIGMRRTEKDIETLRNRTDLTPMESRRISFRPYFFDTSKTKVIFTAPPEEELIFNNREYFEVAVSRPDFNEWDISKEVYALDIPILILQGRQDPVNGTEVQLNERAKNSKLVYLERAGHFPWAEKPVEFFNELRIFLKN